MRRDDLRVEFWEKAGPPYTAETETLRHRPVSDADLASLGLVQRPVCDYCSSNSLRTPEDCPSCGGSGYGRLYVGPCSECGFDLVDCVMIWRESRKCCPDCTHPGGP